jgi:hypothetical protein
MYLPTPSMQVLRAPDSSGRPGVRTGRLRICSIAPGGGSGHSKGNAPPGVGECPRGDGCAGPETGPGLSAGAGHAWDLEPAWSPVPGAPLCQPVVRSQPHRVQQRAPGGAAGLQGGDEGVGPAGDDLGRVGAASVDVAEQALVAGGRVGSQPVREAGCEGDPAVAGPGQRQAGQQAAQAARFHPPRSRAWYIAPCPRRCPAARDSSTRDFTGPSAHSTASASSKSASARVYRQS